MGQLDSLQSHEEMMKIVIIGGGISGLTCAFKLSQSEQFARGLLHITVLENRPRWGGIIETKLVDDCIVDSGPDSFITNKPGMLTLSKELGIESRIIAVNQQNRGALIVSKGKLVPLPAGFIMLAPSTLTSFFQSSVLSWSGKLRSALDLILPPKRDCEDESLAAFVRRRFGQELLDKLAQPMVAGVYVGDAEKLSAAHVAARFVEMERTTGSVIRGLWAERKASAAEANCQVDASGARYSLFAGYDQGMAVVVDSLVQSLTKQNIDLQLNTTVSSITQSADPSASARFTVSSSSPSSSSGVWQCDQVVLATAPKVASVLLADLNAPLSRQLGKITSASSAVCNFIFQRQDIAHPLKAFGAVVSEVEMIEHNLSLVAFSFASIKFARAPQDKVIVRAFLGGVKGFAVLENGDEHLIQLALADLTRLIGLSGKPIYQAVHRWDDSMPQCEVGHDKLIAEIENNSLTPGLHLVGAYLHGVGLPDCVASGYKCADSVLKLMADRCFENSQVAT
ncbi:protoporphyrinogen oxidase [bacterium]|nr:protoporphyrinogen oxidase [bacterium]MBP9808315.1 protoporphyrinogen oxidase [bacterium]